MKASVFSIDPVLEGQPGPAWCWVLVQYGRVDRFLSRFFPARVRQQADNSALMEMAKKHPGIKWWELVSSDEFVRYGVIGRFSTWRAADENWLVR